MQGGGENRLKVIAEGEAIFLLENLYFCGML